MCVGVKNKMRKKIIYKMGEKHPHYGRVVAMGIKDGEVYRFFQSKDKGISLIPLPVLELELKRNSQKA